MKSMFVALLAAVSLVGCVVPASPPQTFLSPVAQTRNPSAEIAVVGGGDALIAGSSRFVLPLGTNAALDLGLSGGYTHFGSDAGVWLRSRKTKVGRSLGFRFGATIGAGSSMASEVIQGQVTAFSKRSFIDQTYGGASFHLQLVQKRPDEKGRISILYGGGITAWADSPNFYVDFGLRYDRPSKIFFGVGAQFLPMSISTDFPIPIYPVGTFGRRF